MPRVKKIPSYRHHKPSGQAVVTLAGKDVYLGSFGSEKSHQAYQRTLKIWPATGTVAKARQPSLTIDDVMAIYWTFAESYYQRNGEPTGECNNIRLALRPLHELYGATPAVNFGPRDLKAVQHAMADAGLCRNVVNARVRKIKRMFKWAVSEQKLPPRVYQGLTTVEGLKKFRSSARETAPVTAVSDDVIEATLPHLPQVVQDMVRIQRACGCRPGELCSLRPADIDRSKQPWEYRPAKHKTDHHDQGRVILLGPRSQNILAKYLDRAPEAFCFSPAESESVRKAAMRARRKTAVQPSQQDRSRPHAERRPGSKYTRQAYLRAIGRAFKKANVPSWSPNQLRHRLATDVREKYGVEVVAAILGHSRPSTSWLYVDRQLRQASQAISEIG